MENCSFQAQLVSVVDILAKAALSEIHRRVDDSCAILRLEITQSQRDIDTLKRKCQLMDGELKRTRIRLRRKGFNTMAAERHPPQIKILLNKEKNVSVWAREMAVEELIHHPPESTDGEPQPDIEPILIKDEVDEDLIGIREEFRITGEDFGTKTGLTPLVELPICEADTQSLQTENSEQYNSVDNPEEPVSMLPSTEKYDLFPGQQPDGDKDDIDLMVKNEKEDEPDQSTILIGSDFGMDDRPLWPSNVGRDIPDLYATEQYQQSSFAFPPQCGLQLGNNVTDDAGPQPHAVGKSNYNMVSSARAKRRSRTFGSKQKHQAMHIHEHGQHSGRANSMGENSMTSHVGQHQYRASEPGVSSNEGLSGSNIVTPTLPAYSRTNFNLARRMRAHWRSGVGEKRFSCTYCTKSFMRFSQLKEHLRSHTGEKPFSCLQCGRSFTKQCNLIRHAVVHSGEKPYECGQCGKCFTQRSSMKSHQKTHVGAGDVSMHVLPSYGGDAHTSLMVPQTRCYK